MIAARLRGGGPGTAGVADVSPPRRRAGAQSPDLALAGRDDRAVAVRHEELTAAALAPLLRLEARLVLMTGLSGFAPWAMVTTWS